MMSELFDNTMLDTRPIRKGTAVGDAIRRGDAIVAARKVNKTTPAMAQTKETE
jgi:hypothetical protein